MSSFFHRIEPKTAAATNTAPFFQAKLTVNAPGDAHEREADQVADRVMRMQDDEEPVAQRMPLTPVSGVQRMCAECEEKEKEKVQRAETTGGSKSSGHAAPSIVGQVLSSGGGRPMDAGTRQFMESRFGQDFGQVRIHTDARAAESAAAIQAKAYTSGRNIVFGAGEYRPESSEGRRLLAHELAHVGQQVVKSNVFRATKGQIAQQNVDSILKEYDDIKKYSDIVKVALKEISAGKSVQFNTDVILKNYLPQLAALTGNKLNSLETEWKWLAKNTKDKNFTKRKNNFFDLITNSRLKSIKNKFPKSHAHDWIRDTDTDIFDLIIKTANNNITAAQLYAYASNEGLSLFIKNKKSVLPTGSKISNESISGFGSLGLDDFMTDLNAKRKPLKNYLPSGYDISTLTPSDFINEKGRTVHSAEFPNVESGLQALLASLTRRRDLFLDDAKAQGYTTPTTEEKIYWTYLYFNPGEFGGLAQLKKYKGKRKLSDWITKGEYPFAQRVLQSYHAIIAMKIF